MSDVFTLIRLLFFIKYKPTITKQMYGTSLLDSHRYLFCPAALVAPIFTVRPQNQTAREGQSVSMNCNATGNPLPNISWYKVGRHEAPIMNGKTFVIAAANRSNAGFYSCVATNGIGKSSTTEAFLNVQCK